MACVSAAVCSTLVSRRSQLFPRLGNAFCHESDVASRTLDHNVEVAPCLHMRGRASLHERRRYPA